jgi:hypothetical protein
VAATAGRPWDNPLFYEVVNYAASRAFERVSGDEHGLWDALRARDERDRTPADMGERFDFYDEQEMRRRLPRLAALCLRDNAALCRTGSSEAAQRTSHRSPGNDPNRRYGEFGLGGVWAADPVRTYGIAKKIRAGMIYINGGGGRLKPAPAFGGYKQSGLDLERGEYGLDEFLLTKSIIWSPR